MWNETVLYAGYAGSKKYNNNYNCYFYFSLYTYIFYYFSHHKTPAIACSYKAAAGYLYPLEKGFIYVHKPPVHIRFEEIASVNFARGGTSSTK